MLPAAEEGCPHVLQASKLGLILLKGQSYNFRFNSFRILYLFLSKRRKKNIAFSGIRMSSHSPFVFLTWCKILLWRIKRIQPGKQGGYTWLLLISFPINNIESLNLTLLLLTVQCSNSRSMATFTTYIGISYAEMLILHTPLTVKSTQLLAPS